MSLWDKDKVSVELKASVAALIGQPTFKCRKSVYGLFYNFKEVNKLIKRVSLCLPATKDRHYKTIDFLREVLDDSGYFWTYKKAIKLT